jgi:hypothetical protein
MLGKTPYGYDLKGSEMSFKLISDIEEMFRTGRFVNPSSGEVIEGGDDAFRYLVIQRAKSIAINNIIGRMGVNVNSIKNPQAVQK